VSFRSFLTREPCIYQRRIARDRHNPVRWSSCPSYVCVEYLIVQRKGAHPDHGEKDGHGSKDRVQRRSARGLLRGIEAIDGHIQCGENPGPTLLSLGVVGHGRDVK
jgi:hypothetical protein